MRTATAEPALSVVERDGDNRLTKAETTRDNVFWDRDGRYFYYPHGPLARLEIGQDNVQGQDHYYSINGWIKGVNMPEHKTVRHDPGRDGDISPAATDDKWVARDAFAYYLGFYADDYNPIGGLMPFAMGTVGSAWADLAPYILSLPNAAAGLYNGNIALMITDLKDAANVSSPNFLVHGQAYAYQYDQLNRLKQMRSHHYLLNPGWSRLGNGTGCYDSDYSYDRNGNIQGLGRRMPDLLGNGTMSSKWMDQLTYHYTTGNAPKQHNKLDHVSDLSPSANAASDLETQLAGNYTYDAIGNLVADQAESISPIRWDLHGKVREVHRFANGNVLAGLKFWYDGTGNRVHKQVQLPGGGVKDEWYVRDPQGNEMAVYERQIENGWLVTRCKEHPIYGADRLGMDLNGVEISRSPVVIEGDPTNPTGDDPAGRHALVIGEILYDSPTTGDDFPTGKEYHEGEYIMLINKSGKALYLGDYQLRVGEDSLALTDTLPAGERVIVGFGDNAGAFGRLVALPAGFDDAVVMQNTLVLPDRSGIVRVTHTSGTEIDGLAYGDFYGLNAENLYLADSLIDSLSRRSSLKSVQRDAYGGPIGISGSAAEGSVGNSDPGVDPEPTEKAVVSSAYTHRGRKVYELKNHLGNVLAVVSDVKIGLSTSSQVEYYVADVVEMTDYEPFGMPLAMRHFVSGDGYRFGFQGQEGDDEWSGEGSMLAFKYRVHDVRLGRFLSVDPLSDSYPWNSTYAFSENRVLDAVELEGLESININSATYANKFRSIFAIKSTTAEEVIQKKNQLYQLFSKMDADERKSGANLYSIDYGYTKGVKLGTYSETIFNSERVYAPKEKSWDEQFEDPSVGIPFMIGVMAIVASGGTLLEAAPPVIAGAATFSEYAFFVVDVWGMASSVNGLAADADGNTPGSNLIEGIGASPEASRNIVTIADFCLNLGGATGDFMTVVTKPEAIGEFSGVLSQISGATDSPNGLVKLVSGVSAGLGSVSMGLDAKNIYDNSGGTSNDRKNDK